VFVRSPTLPATASRLSATGAAPFRSTHGHLQQKAWGSFVCLSIVVGVTHQLILRRAGLSASTPCGASARQARSAASKTRQNKMCTLYLVFKEPRLRRFKKLNLSGFPRPPDQPRGARSRVACPAFPTARRAACFAFVSMAPFRGTFQLYDAAPAMSIPFVRSSSIFLAADAKVDDV